MWYCCDGTKRVGWRTVGCSGSVDGGVLMEADTETLNEVKGEVTDNGDFLVTVFPVFLSDWSWRQLFWLARKARLFSAC